MLRKVTYTVGGLLLLLAAAGLIRQGRTDPSRRPDVLLIGIDTQRADHLRCLGNDWIKTPNLDALARDGVLFKSCRATAPWTLPSFASIFTGLTPSHHGAVGGDHEVLDQRFTTLTECLAAAGYETHGYAGVKWLSDTFGIPQGFEPPPSFDLPASHDGDALTTWLGLSTMDRVGDRPQFTFLHYFSVHAPYAPPAPFAGMYYQGNARGPGAPVLDFLLSSGNAAPGKETGIYDWLAGVTDLQYAAREYAAAVSYVDGQVGEVIDHLKQHGRYDDTLIIIVADHGEHLGEHAYWFTHAAPYEETLRVPLLIKLPRGQRAGTRIDTPVSTLDIMPTLLDWLHLPVPSGDGRSLRGVMEGRDSGAASLLVAEQGATTDAFSKVLVDGSWKLLFARAGGEERYELFDLAGDPGETRNLADQRPDVLARLTARLWQIFDRQHPLGQGELAKPALISGAARRQLRALGYVTVPHVNGAAGAAAPAAGGKAGPPAPRSEPPAANRPASS